MKRHIKVCNSYRLTVHFRSIQQSTEIYTGFEQAAKLQGTFPNVILQSFKIHPALTENRQFLHLGLQVVKDANVFISKIQSTLCTVWGY